MKTRQVCASKDPWSMFCPLDPKQSQLTCANSGEILEADPPSSGFMNGGRQNVFPNSHKWHEPQLAG